MLQSELEQRQSEFRLMESEQDVSDSFKISFRSFSVNDLALFLPTSAPGSDAQRVYLAFHLGCPHRFLSEESISSFSNDGQRYDATTICRFYWPLLMCQLHYQISRLRGGPHCADRRADCDGEQQPVRAASRDHLLRLDGRKPP